MYYNFGMTSSNSFLLHHLKDGMCIHEKGPFVKRLQNSVQEWNFLFFLFQIYERNEKDKKQNEIWLVSDKVQT